MADKVPSWEEIKALSERLSKLKAERERQYEKMKLFGKCVAIAEELGEGYRGKYGTFWKYRGADLTIEFDDYGRNLWVTWNGQSVLKVHLGDLELFRPGSWIQKIDQLARIANQIADERERVRKFKELIDEMKKWEEMD